MQVELVCEKSDRIVQRTASASMIVSLLNSLYEKHECTDACQFYGFHDLRRALGSKNTHLGIDVLEKLMGHSSYAITQKHYINVSDKIASAKTQIHIPERG